jgi:hypothetical protein
MAEVTIREMGVVTLAEALELTALIAFKDPSRHGRAAARWLLRLLWDDRDVTIEDAALATAALQALGGRHHEHALAAPSGHGRIGGIDAAQMGLWTIADLP